jgi:hypothetical protein
MVRFPLALAVVLYSLASPTTPAASASRSSTRCAPPGAHIRLADKAAAFYTFTEKYGNLEAAACAVGHHSIPVGEVFEWDDNTGPCVPGCLEKGWAALIRLNGPVLAFAARSWEDTKYGQCYCESWHIVVRDLRTGRLLHYRPTAPHVGNSASDYYVGLGPAERVVADNGGDVAWILEDFVAWDAQFREGHEQPMSYQVRLIAGHKELLLASAADVNPAFLALHNGMLEWKQGGTRHTAPAR